MDIDERLSRFVDRHEALTQTVEHLALQGEEQNKRIDKLGSHVEKVLTALESLTR